MQNKIRFIIFAFIFLFSAVVVKAFYIQIINRKKLITYSESQFLRTGKIYPKRGNIVDRNKNPLAINIYLTKVAVDPTKINLKNKTAKEINSIIKNLSYRNILKAVSRTGRYSLIIDQAKLSDEQIKKLKNIKGVVVESVAKRFYPNNELASQLVGFVGGEKKGMSGVEYAFNEELTGVPQIYKYYRDAKGRPVKLSAQVIEKQAKEIVLSIDKEIQGSLEEYLKEAVIHHQADGAGAAVMDAETGELYAIGNYPDFNPNNYKMNSIKNTKLGFVSDAMEPGSSFKTFTIISALENSLINTTDKFYCEKGKLKIGKHTISEAELDKNFEWMTANDILKYSSNIGTTKIAFKIGQEKLKETIKNFNFGEKTGIELKGEAKGIYKNNEKMSKIRLSNISFGQGIATTPLQLLKSYAVIANGGFDVKPTILKVKKNKTEKRKLISKKTVDEITKMLVAAVEDGTGTNAKMNHFRVAGKTSTAQRVASGGYSGYVSGFIGFPVNLEKKFVVYVYVDNPRKNGYYGNLVAAPIFKKITSYMLLKNKKQKHFSNAIAGTKIIDKISTISSSHRILDKNAVPNFIGLDKISALNLAKKLNLQIDIKGFGICKRQYPSAGSNQDNKKIVLDFSPPSYE